MSDADYHSGNYSVTVHYRVLDALIKGGKINPKYVEQLINIIAVESPSLDEDVQVPIACFPKTLRCIFGGTHVASYGKADG